MDSIWQQTAALPFRPALRGDIRTKVAIIGGGMTGILLADKLKNEGKDCVVLEARTVGGGQTAGTTAKITAQHGRLYSQLLRRHGEEKTKLYANGHMQAIKAYRTMVEKRKLDCDFMTCRSYLYTIHDRAAAQAEAAVQAAVGLPVSFTDNVPLPFHTAGAACMENQALFHPLLFLQAVSAEMTVYEHTPVRRVEAKRVITDKGTVTADFIVFACHFPFVNFPAQYFMRMHQQRSAVLAISDAPQLTDMYYGLDANDISLRPFRDLLLVGGGNDRTGKGAGTPYAALERRARMYFPQARVAARWSAQDCMPARDFPYIGRFSTKRLNWFVATGYRKWGMTTSMVAADILCAMLCNREHPLEDLYAPHIFLPHEMTQIAEDGCRIVANFAGYAVPPAKKANELKAGEGGAVGFAIGAYRDSHKKLHKVSLRCPHLGCKLHWNAADKTWECPCHGSCFDRRGKRMEGPAQNDINL